MNRAIVVFLALVIVGTYQNAIYCEREPSGEVRRNVALEFRLASYTPVEGLKEATIAGRKIYLDDDIELSDADIARAAAVTQKGEPAIEILFGKEGANKLAELTRTHIGEPLAILIDGRVVSAPVIQAPITGGRALIRGNFTMEEAEEIAEGLNRE